MLNYYKDIGQNFLINKEIIKKIIKFINPNKKKYFLEIGSGTGLLTKELSKYSNKIYSLDIDNNLIKLCKKNIPNVNFIKKDFLKFNFSIFKKKKTIIIGNIPYYISKKIIYKLINNYKYISKIYLVIQKELANNLLFKKKNKKISKTTILINCLFKIKILMNINNKNFYPKPKIKSTLIKLKSNYNKYNIINIKKFIHILNHIFFKKNKKIYNNIKKFLSIKEFKKININPNIRINKLNINKYCKIINYIIKNKIF